MKQRGLFCLVGCLLLVSTLVGCKSRPALDHFWVYDVFDRPVQQRVVLAGQFDEVGKEARVTRLVHFANPNYAQQTHANDGKALACHSKMLSTRFYAVCLCL